MKLKLIKIGNSYSVRIPIETARPFIADGEIELEFPSTPQKNKKDLINNSEESVWDRKIANL